MPTTIVHGELVRDPSHTETLAPRKQDEEERDTLLFVSGWVLLSVAGILCLFLFRYIWRMYRGPKNRNSEEASSSPRGLNEFVLKKTAKNQGIPRVIHQRNDDSSMEGALLPTTDPKAKQGIWRESPVPTNRIQAFFVRMTSLSPPAMSSLLLSDENDNSSTMEHLSDESPTMDIEAPVQLSTDGKVIRLINSPKAEKSKGKSHKKKTPKTNKPKNSDQKKKKSTKGEVDVRSIKLQSGQDNKKDIPVEDPVDSEAEQRERERGTKTQKLEYLKPRPWKEWKFLFTNLFYHPNSMDLEDVDNTREASPERQPVPDEARPTQEDKLSKHVIREKNIALESIYNKNRYSERQKSDASHNSGGSSRKLRRSDTPKSLQHHSSPASSVSSAENKIYPKPSMLDLTSPKELLDRRILGSVTEDVSEEHPQASSHSLPNSSTSPKSRAHKSSKSKRKKTGDGTSPRASPKQMSKASEKADSPKRASPVHKVKEAVPPQDSPVKKKSKSSKKSPMTKKKKKKRVKKSDDFNSLQIPTLLPPPLPPLPFFATSVAANEDTSEVLKHPSTHTVEVTLASGETIKQNEKITSEAPSEDTLKTAGTEVVSGVIVGPKNFKSDPIEDNDKLEMNATEGADMRPEPLEHDSKLERHQKKVTNINTVAVVRTSDVPESIQIVSTLPCESEESESKQDLAVQSRSLSPKNSKISQTNALPPSPAGSPAVKNLVIDEKTKLNLSRCSGHSAPSIPARSAPVSPKRTNTWPGEIQIYASSPKQSSSVWKDSPNTKKKVMKQSSVASTNKLGASSVHSAPVSSKRNNAQPGEIQIYASSPKHSSSVWKDSPNAKKKVIKQSSVASTNKLGASSVHSAPVSSKRNNAQPGEVQVYAPSPKRSSSVSPRPKRMVVKQSSTKKIDRSEKDTAVNKNKVEGSPKPKKKVNNKTSPKKVSATTKAASEEKTEWQGTASPVSTKSVSTSSPADPACPNSERKGPIANIATAAEGAPGKSSEQDIPISASSPPVPAVRTEHKDDLTTASTICESALPRSISVISSSTLSSLDMSHPYTRLRRQRKKEANAAAKRKSKNKVSTRAELHKEAPVKKKKTVKKKGKVSVQRFKPDSPPLTILSSCLVEEMSEITAIWFDDSERSVIAAACAFEPRKRTIKEPPKVKKNLLHESAVDLKTEAKVGSGPVKGTQGIARRVMKSTTRKENGKRTGNKENAVVDGLFTWFTKSKHYRPPVPFDSVSLTRADETGSCVSSISGNASY